MEALRATDNGSGQVSEPLQADRRAAVAELMGRIAAGDSDAIFELHELAKTDLARLVRSEARRLDLRLDADEVWELTLDAAEAVAEVAGAWRPDGAWPWVWAHHRIRRVVHRHVGTFASPLDDQHLELEAPPPVEPIDDPLDVLRQAARRHPAARRLADGLARVGERDARIYLGVALERAAGNRSPAVTVGADHDLQPATVRKVVQRVGERLAQVA